MCTVYVVRLRVNLFCLFTFPKRWILIYKVKLDKVTGSFV